MFLLDLSGNGSITQDDTQFKAIKLITKQI